MNGRVDKSGRAIISVPIATGHQQIAQLLDVWIDTGFTGELMLPRDLIDRLKLPAHGAITGILANGNICELQTFSCRIEWFGQHSTIEVVANDGRFPLLGVGLLLGHRVLIDYQTMIVEID